MNLFDKLFKIKNNDKFNSSTSRINVYIEKDINNKEKCSKCNALVSKDDKYCWKCGHPINELTEEIFQKAEKKESVEYQYPNIYLIKDEKMKTAIKNIPNSGILNIPIGLDKEDRWVYYDITKMPNLLIGGTVMSGKTNIINSLLLSLITKYSTEEIRIILADSKGVDYSCYNGEPHLLIPVIKSVKRLEEVLKNETQEMHNRYSLLSSAEVKKI